MAWLPIYAPEVKKNLMCIKKKTTPAWLHERQFQFALERDMSSTISPALWAPTHRPLPAAEVAVRRLVAIWLLACCGLLFAMVVVGGVTRLTHSGLSIVQWQPIVGTLPPLNEGQWQEAFALYRQTPEYLQVNRGMTLSGFKSIFWWEYAHRLLGRAIGLAFLLPLLYFAVRRRIDGVLMLKLGGIFLLGGLQGALGWYMVKSGLIDDPRVSPLRLTAHLGMAFLIYGAMLWIALDLLTARRAGTRAPAALRRWSWFVAALVFIMMLTGGLVAGTRAGFAYNTFPLMNGRFAPPELFMLEPWHTNLIYNMATVQFDHRLLAYLLALAIAGFWLAARRAEGLSRRARITVHLLAAMLVVQIGLGIGTLLWVVPLPLAAAHQAGALLLFTCALMASHALGQVKNEETAEAR